jgi:hypothetical protein
MDQSKDRQYEKSKPNSGKRPTEENTDSTDPNISTTSATSQLHPCETKDTKPRDSLKSRNDCVKLVLEIIGLAVLCTYTTFAALQWREMKEATDAATKSAEIAAAAFTSSGITINKTLAEMRTQSEAMQKSSDANKQVADTSTKQASISQRNLMEIRNQFRLEQKPWMGVAMISAPIIEVGQPIRLRIDFKNFGKTPANKVAPTLACQILTPGDPLDFSMEARAKKTRMSYGLVYPQGITFASATLKNQKGEETPLNEAYVQDIKSVKYYIYVHGIVEYDDIFGKHHWTRYCYYFDPKTEAWYPHKEYNETDKN